MMSYTLLLRQYKSRTERCECDAGNCKLALDCSVYPYSQTDRKIIVCKLGNSLIHMPSRLEHEMSELLIRPPQPVLFSNLQVLNSFSVQQTLSFVLRHCPQIRELHNVSTQPEQLCAWPDLQCCHTIEQLDQVILHCDLAECMLVSVALPWQASLEVLRLSDCHQAQDQQLAGLTGSVDSISCMWQPMCASFVSTLLMTRKQYNHGQTIPSQ